MCDPVVMMFSGRGCFIIPNLSLWIAVLLCSPTAVPHYLFPVLDWEHKEVGDQGQDNGVVLFSVFVSEGLMFPHYLQFPRAALSCLCFGLEASLSFSAQWVPHGCAPPAAPGVAEGWEVSENASNQSRSQNFEHFQLCNLCHEWC